MRNQASRFLQRKGIDCCLPLSHNNYIPYFICNCSKKYKIISICLKYIGLHSPFTSPGKIMEYVNNMDEIMKIQEEFICCNFKFSFYCRPAYIFFFYSNVTMYLAASLRPWQLELVSFPVKTALGVGRQDMCQSLLFNFILKELCDFSTVTLLLLGTEY